MSFKRNTATSIGDILNDPNPESLMMQSTSTSQSVPKHPIEGSDDEMQFKQTRPTLYHRYNDEEEQSISYDMSNNVDAATDYINVNSKYYDTNTNNSYYEPFVGGASPNSNDSSSNSLTSPNEQCMRKILESIFVICTIFIISPLIFFIAGASQIIPEYARISPVVRKNGDTDDSNVKSIVNYPSIAHICSDNSHFCLRYVFFLVYMITFVIMFICCCSLLAIRKSKHPLKCVYISMILLSE